MSEPPRDRPRRARTSSDATRARILDAARELAASEGFGRFTMEGVAERAGVSRLTVYYQFGSKADLLEALFDDLAGRGRMDRMPEAFQQADPLAGLERFIEVFCGFWATDPIALRRLRSWAALEPGFEQAGRGRDAWQREGLQVLVKRIRTQYGKPAADEEPAVIDLLHALLSPESYEKLAGQTRTPEEVAGLLKHAARRLLGIDE